MGQEESRKVQEGLGGSKKDYEGQSGSKLVKMKGSEGLRDPVGQE